jgi:hypothetical protein
MVKRVEVLKYVFYIFVIAMLIPIFLHVIKLVIALDYTWSYIESNIMKLFDVMFMSVLIFWIISMSFLLKDFFINYDKIYLIVFTRDFLRYIKKSLTVLIIGTVILAIISAMFTGLDTITLNLIIRAVAFIIVYIVILKLIKIIRYY